MESLYDVSAEAQNDLFDIWSRIAADSVTLANRIEDEFYQLFASLGRMPGQGDKRSDLPRALSCCSLYSFLVIYQPDVQPVRILAILRGKRNLKRILRERL